MTTKTREPDENAAWKNDAPSMETNSVKPDSDNRHQQGRVNQSAVDPNAADSASQQQQ